MGSGVMICARRFAIIYVLLLTGFFLAPAPVRAHSGRIALAHPLEGIAVDGDLSEWPADLPSYPLTLTEFGPSPADGADFSASFRIGYDAENFALYLAIEVEDESIVVDTTAAAN